MSTAAPEGISSSSGTSRTSRPLLVTIEHDGVTEVHIPGAASGDYATICGMDGADCGQSTKPTPWSAHVTCSQCIDIWIVIRQIPAGRLDGTILQRVRRMRGSV